MVSVMIAISSVVVVKANNLFPPDCPAGTTIFYYLLDSRIYDSPVHTQNPANYSRIPLPTEWGECEGTVRICAICAVIDNPTNPIPVYAQRPTFSDGSPHTLALVSALNTYTFTNTTWTDDSIPGLIFEKDLQE